MPLTDRKKGEKLDTDEIQILVGEMIDEAQSFIEEVLAPERERATDYYFGRPFGNEDEGRSQVVSTDVRDTVQSMLPSLMRVFFGPERVVEYRPRSKEDIPGAQQATDYANLILLEDNDGFTMMWGVFKDALVRKTGFVKWWWEPHTEISERKYTGLTESAYETLLADTEVEIEDATVEVVELDGQLLNTYTFTARRTTSEGRIRVAAIPPEEVLWNRNATALKTALIVVHSPEVKVSDLVALGFDQDQLEPLAGPSRLNQHAFEGDARRFDRGAQTEEEDQDPATRPIRYDEAYALLDRNGDGHVQLTKICMAGDAHEILERDGEPAIEAMDHLPIALFCPDPEPHTLVGLSMFDYVGDIQKIKSSVLRGTLDSMNLALNPRTEFVEQQVNLKDLLNTEIGGLVRVKQPGMIREVAHRFLGGDTLPMMNYLDDVIATKTGQSKASQGLDPDILQSTTKAAVSATMSKAQERLEIVARIFAETGMKQLFKGLLKTMISHQDVSRMVRLRNEYVDVDPRTWDVNMDVIVNVGLGAGTNEEKLAILQGISEKQAQLLDKLGPMGNPMVSLTKYLNTLKRMTELAGFKNAEEFWNPLTEGQEQQMAQQAQQAQSQQPQGDPATLALVEVEKAKAQVTTQKNQADLAFKQQELQFKQQEALLADDRERDKQAAEYAIKLKEMEVKYSVDIDKAKLAADTEERRAQLDADVKREAQQARLNQRRQLSTSRGEDGELILSESVTDATSS